MHRVISSTLLAKVTLGSPAYILISCEQNSFYMKGCAPSLALIGRIKAIRKWPISKQGRWSPEDYHWFD